MILASSFLFLASTLFLLAEITRAFLHFKNGDKNEINCRQTRKIVQIISGYYPAI
jgi:hypothetical protein